MSKKIIINSMYNSCAKFFSLFFTIILIPYIIKHIGFELFSIWAFINVIIGYISFFDFGFGKSFVKFLSEYKAKNNNEKINLILNTGLIFYFIFSICIFLLFFLSSDYLIIKSKIDPKFYTESKLVLLLSLGLFCIANIMNVISSIQDGFQRMDISGKVKIFFSFIYFIFSILILKLGYGLLGLIFVSYMISIFMSILNILILKRIFPFFKFNIFIFDKLIFKELFIYGIKMCVSNLSTMVNFNFDKILIGYFFNIKGVGFYQVGASLAGIIKSLPVSLIAPFMPAVSEMWSFSKKDEVYEMFLKAVKVLLLIGVPILIYILFRSKAIINIWMGQGYDTAVNIARILIIGYFFYMINCAVSEISQGIGNVGLLAKSEIIALILNIIFSSIFFIFLGYYGAVFGTVLALIISFIYLIYKFLNFFKRNFFEYICLYIKPCLSAVCSILICYLFFNNIIEKIGNKEYVKLSIIGLEFFIFIIIYIIMIIRLEFFKKSEIKFFINVFINKEPVAK